MTEQFISAAIRPVVETLDAVRMSTGEPGLPRQFRWRGRTIQITQVLRTWRETGPCHHGSGEAYVRKHWFEVLTDSGETMKIYFERQRRSRNNTARWWLFTIDKA
jgi:phosphoribosylglycinamide formyltransferase-1